MENFPSIGLSIFTLLIAAYIYQKYQPPPKPNMVGIDLGTTFSSIGTFHSVSGNVTIYTINDNSKSVPSQIFFSKDGKIFIGHEAQMNAQDDPTNLLYDAKRFIGKTFDQIQIEQLSHLYAFDLKLIDGNIYFVIHTTEFKNTALYILKQKLSIFCSKDENDPYTYHKVEDNMTLISPECVGAILIAVLLKTAEKNIGRQIKKGVIAVPANFDLEQEKRTYQAAKLAGISIQRVISEPTAAALSYGLHLKEDINNVVVIDIGGGTTDISLLMLENGMFHVRSLSGNNRLGGQDFNKRLYDHLNNEVIKLEYGQNVEISRHDDLQKLKSAIEAAKLYLSGSTSSLISGDTAYKDLIFDLELQLHLTNNVTGNIRKVDFRTSLNTPMFERANKITVDKIIETLEDCLKFGGIIDLNHKFSTNPEDIIQEVVLVGGSVKVPLIYKTITQYFENYTRYINNNKDALDSDSGDENQFNYTKTNVHLSDDPELAVVKGVSIMAGIMGGAWPLTVSAIEPYPRNRFKNKYLSLNQL